MDHESTEVPGDTKASVGLATFVVVGIGWWLVKTRLPGALERTPEAMRSERAALGDAEMEDEAEAAASVS